MFRAPPPPPPCLARISIRQSLGLSIIENGLSLKFYVKPAFAPRHLLWLWLLSSLLLLLLC